MMAAIRPHISTTATVAATTGTTVTTVIKEVLRPGTGVERGVVVVVVALDLGVNITLDSVVTMIVDVLSIEIECTY